MLGEAQPTDPYNPSTAMDACFECEQTLQFRRDGRTPPEVEPVDRVTEGAPFRPAAFLGDIWEDAIGTARLYQYETKMYPFSIMMITEAIKTKIYHSRELRKTESFGDAEHYGEVDMSFRMQPDRWSATADSRRPHVEIKDYFASCSLWGMFEITYCTELNIFTNDHERISRLFGELVK